MQLMKTRLNVFPNPTNSSINLTISNYAGSNVTATLFDTKGNILHKEILSVTQSIGSYKLNLRNIPASGVYLLRVKGENLYNSIKVIVNK